MVNKVTLVSGYDWQGVYNNMGELLTQGHSISPQELLEKLGYEISYVAADENWLSIYGWLPDKIEEVRIG